MDLRLLNEQMESIQRAGDAFNEAIASQDDHLGNGIAGAAAVAGLKILRRSGADLQQLAPGTIVLTNLNGAESDVFTFMEITSQHLGLRRGPFWKRWVPPPYRPLRGAGDLAGTLEKLFDDVVSRYQIWPGFHALVAVYAAMRTVESAHERGFLHSAAGRRMVAKYVVAGARTVPARG